MKRLIFSLLCILAFLTLFGCKKEDSSDTKKFHGTVAEVNGDTMIVEPDAGSEELKSADKFSVSISELPEAEKPLVGDSVEIIYSGYIREIYPAGLDGITDITIIHKGE